MGLTQEFVNVLIIKGGSFKVLSLDHYYTNSPCLSDRPTPSDGVDYEYEAV